MFNNETINFYFFFNTSFNCSNGIGGIKKNNDLGVKKCYLAKCPRDICNIIAEMLEWQPHAFKRFVPETDEELIKRASLQLNNSEYKVLLQEKKSAKDYPDYKGGKLTIKVQPITWPTYLFGFKVFALIAHNTITNKNLICAYGTHYLYTNKMLTASPNKTKILWVEEEETYQKNALLYTDSINIYDLVTDKNHVFKKKFRHPLSAIAISNTRDMIARTERIECRGDRCIISLLVEKLATGQTVTKDYDVSSIDDITFNAQGTKLIVSRKRFDDKHDFALIDLSSLQKNQPSKQAPKNKLLAIFKAMGVCKNLNF